MIQDPPALYVGFSRGAAFTDGLLKARLEGLELGGEFPSTSNHVTISPSIVLGGSNRKGADTDGNIFRLLVALQRPPNRSGVTLGLAAGLSATAARSFTGAGAATGNPNLNKEFHDTSGVIGQLRLGYQGAELRYTVGSDPKLSGLSLGFRVRR